MNEIQGETNSEIQERFKAICENGSEEDQRLMFMTLFFMLANMDQDNNRVQGEEDEE